MNAPSVGGDSTLNLDKRKSSVIVHVLEILSVFVRRLDLCAAEYQRPTSPNAHAGRLHGILRAQGPGEAVPSAPLRVGL